MLMVVINNFLAFCYNMHSILLQLLSQTKIGNVPSSHDSAKDDHNNSNLTGCAYFMQPFQQFLNYYTSGKSHTSQETQKVVTTKTL